MTYTDFVRTSEKGFKYIEVPAKNTQQRIAYNKICENARNTISVFGQPLNNSHLGYTHLPKLFITGEFRKYCNLTIIENFFLLFIIDNMLNDNSSNNAWVTYYQYFDYITSSLITQKKVLTSLKEKGLINITDSGNSLGIIIDYSPTIHIYNELFDSIINNNVSVSEQPTRQNKNELQYHLYFKYLNMYYEKYYIHHKYFTMYEKAKLNSITGNALFYGIENIYGYIPMYLATRQKEHYAVIQNSNASPLLYFFSHFEVFYDDYNNFVSLQLGGKLPTATHEQDSNIELELPAEESNIDSIDKLLATI